MHTYRQQRKLLESGKKGWQLSEKWGQLEHQSWWLSCAKFQSLPKGPWSLGSVRNPCTLEKFHSFCSNWIHLVSVAYNQRVLRKEGKKLIYSQLKQVRNTVDPWGRQRLGMPTLCIVENWNINYSQLWYPRFLWIHGCTFTDSTNCRLWSTVVFTIEKSMYKWTHTVQTLVAKGSTVILTWEGP